MPNEAKARILINNLLHRSGWRFFDDQIGRANIMLEAPARVTRRALDNLGDDFERTARGFVDYLLLDERGFPIADDPDKVTGFKLHGTPKRRIPTIIQTRCRDSQIATQPWLGRSSSHVKRRLSRQESSHICAIG